MCRAHDVLEQAEIRLDMNVRRLKTDTSIFKLAFQTGTHATQFVTDHSECIIQVKRTNPTHADLLITRQVRQVKVELFFVQQ